MKKISLYKNNFFSLFTFLFLFLLRFSLLHAESEFSLRIAPIIETPTSITEFNSGFGADISLDWAFFQFARNFNLGVSIGGAYSSLPFPTGDPLVLIEGKAGVFLKWRPFDRWAFSIAGNGGFYQYIRGEKTDNNFLASGNLGLEFYLSPYFSLFTEGEYTYRVFSSKPFNTFGAAVGVRINLSEIMGGRSRIRIEKTEQYRVFPVSWAWYEDNPVAAVTVTNEEANTITDVNLSFYMDSFMSQPWTFAVVPRLAPGESVNIEVTSLFNEAMMNLNETVNANGLLQTQYRSLGSRKETDITINMPIFRRNFLSWDDDRRAAAFVSPNDFSAKVFAKYVQTAVNNEQIINKEGRIPINVIYAAALFEALRLYGINYIIDPSSSYIALSENASALDSLNYPYETLRYRGGDCDDLSILFCSLLEALDVETAFITVPGHIFAAFNVGDPQWYANSGDIIELDGKRWLPLEITVPSEGFTRAWRIGTRQWRANSSAGIEQDRENSEKAKLLPIREAWKIYPSVTVPSSGDYLQDLPEWDMIIFALEKEINNFRR